MIGWWFSIKQWHQSLFNHLLSSLNAMCHIYQHTARYILFFFTIHHCFHTPVPFSPYSTLLLQVTPCSTVWWLWQDAALWGRCRILRFSGSHRQTLYPWRMIQQMRTESLRCEKSWTQDTSTLPGLPLESAWTWVSMHIAGSLKTLQITASFGKRMKWLLFQDYSKQIFGFKNLWSSRYKLSMCSAICRVWYVGWMICNQAWKFTAHTEFVCVLTVMLCLEPIGTNLCTCTWNTTA